ncbi:MAG TPA: class I SAM-dependent methyltransferase [Bryobacteraceae bacterium]|nr:class I SAM-dependent methyltransferase [Bryobacteraceae bacterium]
MLKLYSSLAEWWPLLSAPDEYAEEAAAYVRLLAGADGAPMGRLVEFGSGGGNNASHMKNSFASVTLVDASPDMLAVSRSLNPDCEHLLGDMRTVRLGRQYDCVFIHDAICYMTTADELQAAIRTAYEHCRPGGSALFVPDAIRENFSASTECGGCDGEGHRGLRYLGWTWDPDPDDTTYIVDYAYILREADGSTRTEHDRNEEGLFSRAEWLQSLASVGFQAHSQAVELSEVESGSIEVFVGARPL